MAALNADSFAQFATLHKDVGSMYAAFMQGREDELRRVISGLRVENSALRGSLAATPAPRDDAAVSISAIAEAQIQFTTQVTNGQSHDAGADERVNEMVARLLPKIDLVEGELEVISSRMSALATSREVERMKSKISALTTGFQEPKSRVVTTELALPIQEFQVWEDWKPGLTTYTSRQHAQHFEDFDEWIADNVDKRATEFGQIARASSVYRPNTASACIMHPDSTYRLWWELMSMGLLLYDLIAIPLMAFNPQGLLTEVMDWTTCIFWTCDLLFAFRIGYYEKSGTVVLSSCLIALHYVKTWLIIDTLVISIDWSFMTGLTTSSIFRYGKLMRGLRLLRLLRLLRIMKMKNISEEVQMRLNSEYASLVVGVINHLFFILLLAHFIACTWFGVGNLESGSDRSWVDAYSLRDRDMISQYTVALHWSLTQFTPASMHVQPQSDTERGFAILVVVFGLVVYGTFVSAITSTMTHLRELSARRNTQMWKLRRFLTDRQISRRLTMRITKYLTVVASLEADRVHENQVDILGLLSVPLRQRLNREVYAPKLEIHPLFGFLSKHRQTTFMSLCCGAFAQDQFSKGDVLFHASVAAVSMFIVTEGSFIYIPADQTLKPTIMPAGTWFAEAILWMPWVHRGTMCAYEVTGAVEVQGKSFREAMQRYPDDAALAQAYAAAFAKLMGEADETLVVDIEPDGDKLTNILWKVTENQPEQRLEPTAETSPNNVWSHNVTADSSAPTEDATDSVRI